jgi:hypothetical protein
MLADVFNPTETKKNGPASRPARTPARRSVARFTAASAVLPATAQSYGDARDGVNARLWRWFMDRSRAAEHSPREWPQPDVEPCSQEWPLAKGAHWASPEQPPATSLKASDWMRKR